MWEVIDSISRYVLLHHTMGGYDGGKTWCYVEGGMGSVSMAIAKAAQLHGAELYTEKVSLLQYLSLFFCTQKGLALFRTSPPIFSTFLPVFLYLQS